VCQVSILKNREIFKLFVYESLSKDFNVARRRINFDTCTKTLSWILPFDNVSITFHIWKSHFYFHCIFRFTSWIWIIPVMPYFFFFGWGGWVLYFYKSKWTDNPFLYNLKCFINIFIFTPKTEIIRICHWN